MRGRGKTFFHPLPSLSVNALSLLVCVNMRAEYLIRRARGEARPASDSNRQAIDPGKISNFFVFNCQCFKVVPALSSTTAQAYVNSTFVLCPYSSRVGERSGVTFFLHVAFLAFPGRLREAHQAGHINPIRSDKGLSTGCVNKARSSHLIASSMIEGFFLICIMCTEATWPSETHEPLKHPC